MVKGVLWTGLKKKKKKKAFFPPLFLIFKMSTNQKSEE